MENKVLLESAQILSSEEIPDEENISQLRSIKVHLLINSERSRKK